MYPRPRDYRRGTFKFTSTPYGAKPLREDLLRTIRHGARGTAMPAFVLFPEEDLQAVVDYVLVLTHRGELELLMAAQADAEDDVDTQAIPGLITDILASWNKAPQQTVEPVTREPPYTRESIELGKKAFLSETAICYKCHGEDGRGQTAENLKGFQDAWGFRREPPTCRPACSTAATRRPISIAASTRESTARPCRRSRPSWPSQPEMFWHLVHYVQYISSARRRKVVNEYNARKAAWAPRHG